MCLAIPLEVVAVLPDGRGRVRRDGVEIEVDLSLVEGARPGDYVIVHAGFAIERLDLDEAEARLELFRGMSEE